VSDETRFHWLRHAKRSLLTPSSAGSVARSTNLFAARALSALRLTLGKLVEIHYWCSLATRQLSGTVQYRLGTIHFGGTYQLTRGPTLIACEPTSCAACECSSDQSSRSLSSTLRAAAEDGVAARAGNPAEAELFQPAQSRARLVTQPVLSEGS
jgi:hypothetical protein